MDFRLSSEQDMLRDGARRFISTELDFDARTKQIAEGRDQWSVLAEMGWLMLPVSEQAGGLGSSLEDIALIAEELGRGVAIEPFVTCAFLPARLLDHSGAGRAADMLSALATGESRFAVALYEAESRYSLDGLTSAVAHRAGGLVLNGRKPLVFGGAEADHLIVGAQAPDGQLALYLVSTSAPGLSRRSYRTIDNFSVADIVFDDVALDKDAILLEGSAVRPVLDRALEETIVLLCMDALGCMDRAIELTADYLHIRQQFGKPLASFQALQHGVANLFIDANEARSLTYRALAACLEVDAAERSRFVSACKYRVMDTARRVTGQAIHFHGGIGMTCEYPVGEHLRRVLVAEQVFGNGQYHREKYIAEVENRNVRNV